MLARGEWGRGGSIDESFLGSGGGKGGECDGWGMGIADGVGKEGSEGDGISEDEGDVVIKALIDERKRSVYSATERKLAKDIPIDTK